MRLCICRLLQSNLPVASAGPNLKIDIGDGQTIRQENVFENHCLFNANLTEAVSLMKMIKN
jgi:2-succinyl-5-enolpyruvyl-6-hydroxy-3-cyclohexene-1-carboxylate synthase